MFKSSNKNIVKVPFSITASVTLATGRSIIILYPNQFGRLTAIADNWQEYRFTQVKFRLLVPATSANEYVIMSYYPGVTDATPAITDLNEVPVSAQISLIKTTDSEWINIPRSVLAGMMSWYKTVPGSIDAGEEQQGAFYIASSNAASTAQIRFQLMGVIEFTGSADPGSTPAERALAARARVELS